MFIAFLKLNLFGLFLLWLNDFHLLLWLVLVRVVLITRVSLRGLVLLSIFRHDLIYMFFLVESPDDLLSFFMLALLDQLVGGIRPKEED
jgi:hypothetical protein